MHGKNPGEFHYYLDNRAALDLLVAEGADRRNLDFEGVRRNKEKSYADINDPTLADETPGRLLFLKHEAMISRFHAMLEMACAEFAGRLKLEGFQQGPELWHEVEVPKLSYKNGVWMELDQTETLPHRPDAFFTLSFPHDAKREPLHFFYEADRKTTNTHKYNKKLRAHFHFAVKQKELLKKYYGLNRIRAVLTETIDDDWAETLRQAAGSVRVSGSKPSPLFWFTTSRLFVQSVPAAQGQSARVLPIYLQQPETVFRKIWASPVDDTFHSLIDK